MARKNEFNDMDLAGLADELRASKHEALNLRFRNATGQLEKPPKFAPSAGVLLVSTP